VKPAATDQTTPTLELGALGILFCLGTLLLRIPGMTESLWFDETWRTSARLNPQYAFDVLIRDVHNPLYNGFMYLWIRVVGESEWVLRLPSLLAGYLSVLLFCRWLARIHSPRLARWTGAWLLLAPAHLWYSAEAKNNMFTVLFSVIILTTFWRLAEDRRRRATLFAGLATALAILNDFATLTLLVPAAVCVVTDRCGRPFTHRLRSIGAALGIGLTLTAPLLVYKAMHLDSLARSYARHLDLRELCLLLVNYFPSGNALIPIPLDQPGLAFEGTRLILTLTAGILCLGLITTAMVAAHRRRQHTTKPSGDRSPVKWLALSLIIPLVGVFFASAALHMVWPDRGRYIYQERNLLPLLYPYAALICAGLLALRHRVLRQGAMILAFSIPLIADGLLLGPHAGEWTVYKPTPDWRAAATWLKENVPTDPPPVVLARCPSDPLAYYHSPLRRVRLESWPPSAAYLTDLTERFGAGEFYLVTNQFWFPIDVAQLTTTAPQWQAVPVLKARALQLYRLKSK
jgi:hypothetical protein